MIIGADVGGTFTDVVAIDESGVVVRKVPTTEDPADAVRDVMEELAGSVPADALIHGTTVATNALLERSGARTVLITDEGFEDILEIGRQDRPSLYDPYVDRAEPLVDRTDRIGVSGIDVPDIGSAEAVAVALVRGHADEAREAAIATQVARRLPGIPISRSSVVAPEFREFERTSTTVLNAYLSPITAEYLRQLDRSIVGRGRAGSVSVMRSSGGLMSLPEAAELPSAILLSGPAGGVVAAAASAEDSGIRSVVSFDMGGTSTDVCLIVDGEIDVSYERSVAGHACRMPSVAVHTVGAGGGSIAWIDPGGALRVGPASAGSHPGPACYGRGGTEATVTDANVVLGRIDPDARLGGTLSIDPDLARAAVGRLAERLAMTIEQAALGMLAIAEETMAGAVRTVSVTRGHDPSGAHLIAFGGAGGLHATAVARRLGMAGVLVPAAAGVLSAVGLLLSPPRSDAVRAAHITGRDLEEARRTAEALRRETVGSVTASTRRPTETSFLLDVRYLGQAHEIAVPWEPQEDTEHVVARFGALHRQRYGFDRSGDPVEIVAVRTATVGERPLSALPRESVDAPVRPHRRHVVGNDGIRRSTAIVPRSSLTVGDVLSGPAVVEERDTTIFVDHDERATLTDSGAVEVTW